MNVKPLLRLVLSTFFGTGPNNNNSRGLLLIILQKGDASGFVSMLVNHIPSPVANAANKVEHTYTGPLDSVRAQAMLECDPNGPLVVHVVKLFASADSSTFDAFARVISGTLKQGARVRVLGEGYSPEDEEDLTEQTVGSISVFNSRYATNLFLIYFNLEIAQVSDRDKRSRTRQLGAYWRRGLVHCQDSHDCGPGQERGGVHLQASQVCQQGRDEDRHRARQPL